MNNTPANATATVESTPEQYVLKVGGEWRLTESLPQLENVMPHEAQPRPVKVVPAELSAWDSSLPLFLLHVRGWCDGRHSSLDIEALPDQLKKLFGILSQSNEKNPAAAAEPQPHPARHRFRQKLQAWKSSVSFVGECAIAAARVPAQPRQFSWRDFLEEMIAAGPKALPIIGGLSFLIGLTFAFDTAIQLQRFGAVSFVIPGVGLAVLRQTGPTIAAMVLAGRTGAAFAARIANMNLGGELDALELLGVSPVQYLILPRVLALALMMPLITLYSDFFGLLGGLVIGVAKLDMPAIGFMVQMKNAVGMSDLMVGLIKSVVYGGLIGVLSTLCGLHSERSSQGVGRAVTSAVVRGIAAVVTADALFAPIFKQLGI